MEDDQKIQNGRQRKKFKMEDNKKIQYKKGNDEKNSKWKTTKKNQSGRRPKKFKMEDNKKFKMEDDQKNLNERRPKN